MKINLLIRSCTGGDTSPGRTLFWTGGPKYLFNPQQNVGQRGTIKDECGTARMYFRIGQKRTKHVEYVEGLKHVLNKSGHNKHEIFGRDETARLESAAIEIRNRGCRTHRYITANLI